MPAIKGKRCSVVQLRRMREAGMGQTQIAKLLNVDHTTVSDWLKLAGLPTRLAKPLITDEAIDAAIAKHHRYMRQRYYNKRAAE